MEVHKHEKSPEPPAALGLLRQGRDRLIEDGLSDFVAASDCSARGGTAASTVPSKVTGTCAGGRVGGRYSSNYSAARVVAKNLFMPLPFTPRGWSRG